MKYVAIFRNECGITEPQTVSAPNIREAIESAQAVAQLTARELVTVRAHPKNINGPTIMRVNVDEVMKSVEEWNLV